MNIIIVEIIFDESGTHQLGKQRIVLYSDSVYFTFFDDFGALFRAFLIIKIRNVF